MLATAYIDTKAEINISHRAFACPCGPVVTHAAETVTLKSGLELRKSLRQRRSGPRATRSVPARRTGAISAYCETVATHTDGVQYVCVSSTGGIRTHLQPRPLGGTGNQQLSLLICFEESPAVRIRHDAAARFLPGRAGVVNHALPLHVVYTDGSHDDESLHAVFLQLYGTASTPQTLLKPKFTGGTCGEAMTVMSTVVLIRPTMTNEEQPSSNKQIRHQNIATSHRSFIALV